MKITAEEKQHVIVKLAEYMKDVVFINAHEKAEEAFKHNVLEEMNGVDRLNIQYDIQFDGGIIAQILGDYRRNPDKYVKPEPVTLKKREELVVQSI